jgi:hypothetical protein
MVMREQMANRYRFRRGRARGIRQIGCAIAAFASLGLAIVLGQFGHSRAYWALIIVCAFSFFVNLTISLIDVVME